MGTKKIFIVEDEKINIIYLTKMLEIAGYDNVISSESAEDAISLIFKDIPDILLVDYSLKGKINGVQLARIIRKELSIPIIFLTASQEDWVLEEIKMIENSICLSKPFEQEDLLDLLKELLPS